MQFRLCAVVSWVSDATFVISSAGVQSAVRCAPVRFLLEIISHSDLNFLIKTVELVCSGNGKSVPVVLFMILLANNGICRLYFSKSLGLHFWLLNNYLDTLEKASVKQAYNTSYLSY